MPQFSSRSQARLATCDQRLQDICNELIKHYDVTVLCGHRTEARQRAALLENTTRVKFPNSKHNTSPSRAVDLAPYPIDWSNIKSFHEMAGRVKQIADTMGIKIKWGGNFKGFFDGPHFQLNEE